MLPARRALPLALQAAALAGSAYVNEIQSVLRPHFEQIARIGTKVLSTE